MGVDVDGGAAELGDADGEGVAAVAVAHDFALEALEASADDAHIVVDAVDGGLKRDGAVGMAEHVLEPVQLAVGDDGDGLVETAGFDAAVDHEAVDVGELHDVAALAVGAADEDDAGDHDAQDPAAATVAPYPDFLLRGHVILYTE